MLDPELSPIKYKRVSEKTGKEVACKDIQEGIEVAKGKFFVPTKEQLAAVKPEKSDTIDIVEFVNQDQIDPVYFSRFTLPLGAVG